MPKFAANISTLFTEVPFLDRFEAVAEAGFAGVECQFPYEFEVDALAARLRRFGLVPVMHNLPAGDWAAGERGIACLPGRGDEFRAGIDLAIRYASALGCRQVNCLAGIAAEGTDRRLLKATLLENLRYAAGRLREAGIRLLVEPVNTRDVPGYVLHSTRQARSLIAEGAIDDLQIQYDLYHMQIMEGDVSHTLVSNRDLIGHVQIADNPGRHEPGTGEVNFDHVFRLLDEIGYGGWVGCEYMPAGATRDGLGWFAPWQAVGARAVA
jgi:hydroxypyruvate isomerase